MMPFNVSKWAEELTVNMTSCLSVGGSGNLQTKYRDKSCRCAFLGLLSVSRISNPAA